MGAYGYSDIKIKWRILKAVYTLTGSSQAKPALPQLPIIFLGEGLGCNCKASWHRSLQRCGHSHVWLGGEGRSRAFTMGPSGSSEML